MGASLRHICTHSWVCAPPELGLVQPWGAAGLEIGGGIGVPLEAAAIGTRRRSNSKSHLRGLRAWTLGVRTQRCSAVSRLRTQDARAGTGEVGGRWGQFPRADLRFPAWLRLTRRATVMAGLAAWLPEGPECCRLPPSGLPSFPAGAVPMAASPLQASRACAAPHCPVLWVSP